MSYWQLYYHFVWTTKNRLPLITTAAEPLIYGYIVKKAVGLGGIIHALNGFEDHVHLAVSVPPSIPVSTFIGQVKGVSSAKTNQSQRLPHLFYWQSDYWVSSFEKNRLNEIVSYIENQKCHHAQNQLISDWEVDFLPNKK